MALVPQGLKPFFSYTCLETALMGLHPRTGWLGLESEAHLKLAENVMRKAGCWKYAHKSVLEISGGEFQRVVLAKALVQLTPLPGEAQSPKLLLLDEAMSELDICAKFEMMDLIKELVKERGLSVVGIHHDIHLAALSADKALVLKDGRVAALGKPDEILTKKLFKEVFSVEAEPVSGRGFVFLGRA
jgi:iron complex transport system ATP-binding protein